MARTVASANLVVSMVLSPGVEHLGLPDYESDVLPLH